MSLFRRMQIRIKTKLCEERRKKLGKCFKCPYFYTKDIDHYPEGYCRKYASGWYEGINNECHDAIKEEVTMREYTRTEILDILDNIKTNNLAEKDAIELAEHVITDIRGKTTFKIDDGFKGYFSELS